MAAKELSIDGLDIDQLMELKEKVEGRIHSLAKEKLNHLEEEMERLAPYLSTKGKRRTAGSKVAAKFRDPATGKTWTGRGRTPTWIVEYEKKGKSRDTFAI